MLPRLIFAAMTHADPITPKILLALLPKLKKLGYECYFAECSEGLQNVIQFNHAQIEQANKTQKDFKFLGLDIKNDIDVKQYIAMQAKYYGYNDVEKFIQEKHDLCYWVKMAVVYYEFRLANLDLLKSLENSKMNFKEVDWGGYKSISEATSPDGTQKRDKHMASAYLHTQLSVFGTIGLNHVAGIQKEFLNHVSHEQASEQFCFFSIYSYPPDHSDEKIINKETVFPLDLICIDATKNNEEKIIETVLKEIYKRILPKLKLPLVDSLKANSISSTRDGFFTAVGKSSLPALTLPSPLEKNQLSTAEKNLPRLCSLTLSPLGS